MAARGREMRFFLWTRNIMLKMTDADFDDVVGFLAEVYNGRTITAIDPMGSTDETEHRQSAR